MLRLCPLAPHTALQQHLPDLHRHTAYRYARKHARSLPPTPTCAPDTLPSPAPVHCRVSPLYKHTIALAHAPTLAFIGVPFKVSPFPMFEAQARWVARLLSGRISLPSPADMRAGMELEHTQMEQQGRPVRWAVPHVLLHAV